MHGLRIEDLPLLRATTLVDGGERFSASNEGRAWLDQHFGPDYTTSFTFNDDWRYISTEILLAVFSFDEVIWQWMHHTVTMSGFDRQHYADDTIVWKLRNSMWHYGRFEPDNEAAYQTYVRLMACLRSLRIDLPGFELRLTHTPTSMTAGPAIHVAEDDKNLWLDASFGLLLFYKGTHVMTIGFGLSARGVFVSQVQLRRKHGNRFLYKLPGHHLDFALDLLARAFPNDTIHLATGASCVEGIKRSYRKNVDKFDVSAIPRILDLYDRQLQRFQRTEHVVKRGFEIGMRDFVALERASASGVSGVTADAA
jgi:hypothetical protein